MDRTLLLFIFSFVSLSAFTQPDTEVFLFDFEFRKEQLEIKQHQEYFRKSWV